MIEKQKTDGAHLFLLMWKAFKSVEAVDLKSIQARGFKCLSDFALLEVIYHKGPLPVNTIAQKVFLTSGSMTAAVNRAEAEGLVERIVDADDRRIFHVHLTDAGHAKIESAFADHAKELERIFTPFNKEEKEQFAQLLKKAGKSADALSL